MASIGQRRHLVRLEDRPKKGQPAVMTPDSAYVALRPLSPGVDDEDHVSVQVEMAYHPQVNTETWLVTASGREFTVMGVQNVDEQNRDLVLLCHEVKTP
jgi:hypothetical protein